MRLTLWAPAKVNLFLEVLGKRPDGYHDVQTLLQHVDLCDEIQIVEDGTGIAVESDGLPCPGGEENLAYRAAALFGKATGIGAGVRIHIVKRIPLGAGLGGGVATLRRRCGGSIAFSRPASPENACVRWAPSWDRTSLSSSADPPRGRPAAVMCCRRCLHFLPPGC
jgi:hypothetical protein